MRKFIFAGLAILFFVAAGLVLFGTVIAAAETALYELVEKDGDFEIRRYGSLRLVTTPMKDGDNASFRRLAGYIGGENEKDRKIAMTSPVFMPTDEKGTKKKMQFVMPSDLEEFPAPTGSEVERETFSAGRYAVLRFSGRSSDERYREKLGKLRDELEARGLETTGDPLFAGYDPPWTPAPFRRNEVLLPLR